MVACNNSGNLHFENYKKNPSDCFWNHKNPLSDSDFTAISKSCQKALKTSEVFPKYSYQIDETSLKLAFGEFGRSFVELEIV